ncbi:3-oxo-tetronate 4-phosphate decarboxylase [Ahrensia kielensis]|uniref:3-oxo-tetronate 4-phosphate decarboxylase n=1 Tax=Ahrensia kielensis TaxID=76980 RepID=UPI00037E7469|nr:3-oxo-tetronate 4-phosphate decarboxylase [Ahrensia kielensis]
MREVQLREQICLMAKSLYDRGLAHGSTGNISARLDDGGLLVTPTNSSFGFLDPAKLSHFDAKGQLIGGDKPTKEMSLHQAFYETRGAKAGAVVHLHSHHSVALSLFEDTDKDDFLPPLTPYPIMKLGKVKLLPFFAPGDAAMGEAIRDLAGAHSAVMLANHGPVVAGSDIASTIYAMEELEAAARLAIETRGQSVRGLTTDQITRLTASFSA